MTAQTVPYNQTSAKALREMVSRLTIGDRIILKNGNDTIGIARRTNQHDDLSGTLITDPETYSQRITSVEIQHLPKTIKVQSTYFNRWKADFGHLLSRCHSAERDMTIHILFRGTACLSIDSR